MAFLKICLILCFWQAVQLCLQKANSFPLHSSPKYAILMPVEKPVKIRS